MAVPKRGKDTEVYRDADFAGNWDKDESVNRDTSRSSYDYIIMYSGYPLVWKSQL